MPVPSASAVNALPPAARAAAMAASSSAGRNAGRSAWSAPDRRARVALAQQPRPAVVGGVQPDQRVVGHLDARRRQRGRDRAVRGDHQHRAHPGGGARRGHRVEGEREREPGVPGRVAHGIAQPGLGRRQPLHRDDEVHPLHKRSC